MKNLNAKDFSYKGQQSQFQSDDTNVFQDENNMMGHAIFGLTHSTDNDDKLSFTSDQGYGDKNGKSKDMAKK